MLDSIDNGPLVYATVEEIRQTRHKKYSKLTEEQKLQDDCDVQATNIILYCLPPDVYALVNHHEVAKAIWDKVKLLMKGIEAFTAVLAVLITRASQSRQHGKSEPADNSRSHGRTKFILGSPLGTHTLKNSMNRELQSSREKRLVEGHLFRRLLKMRIEQYFLMTDYSLWEVILNGDSPIPTRVIDGVIHPVAPTIVEQRLARKNDLKARETLLMALPDKHRLKFNIHKYGKSLMEAIE
nr:hypothetical protein [Tanacetum cinerariifolium]